MSQGFAYRGYLSYYTDGRDEYHATNVLGMVTDIPGYISPFRFLLMDTPKPGDPLVAEASTFNSNLNRDCSHRGHHHAQDRGRDDGSIAIEDVFQKLFDEYSEECIGIFHSTNFYFFPVATVARARLAAARS